MIENEDGVLILTPGEYDYQQMAKWMGVQYQTFRHRRDQYLIIIAAHADFFFLENKHIEIIKVYQEICDRKILTIRKNVQEHFFDCWGYNDAGQGNRMLDTCVSAARKYINKYGKGNLKESTIVHYFQQDKERLFGKNSVKKIKQKKGLIGFSKYIFCKRLKNGKFIEFTQEEKRIKFEILKELLLERIEINDFEEFKELILARKNEEINLEKYLEINESKYELFWSEYISRLEKKFNCICTYATLLIIDENEIK